MRRNHRDESQPPSAVLSWWGGDGTVSLHRSSAILCTNRYTWNRVGGSVEFESWSSWKHTGICLFVTNVTDLRLHAVAWRSSKPWRQLLRWGKPTCNHIGDIGAMLCPVLSSWLHIEAGGTVGHAGFAFLFCEIFLSLCWYCGDLFGKLWLSAFFPTSHSQDVQATLVCVRCMRDSFYMYPMVQVKLRPFVQNTPLSERHFSPSCQVRGI